MILIPLFLGWLSFLIYGIALLRASKHRKTGITLITLFFAPIVLVAFLVWYMDYEYLSCMLNGTSETIDYCRSLQSRLNRKFPMKRFHLELILIIAFIIVVAVVPLIYMGDDTIDKLTCSPADSSMCAGWAVDRL